MQPRPDTYEPPLVSVAIITYNQEKYIRPAIESALDQTYQNIEIVVGDDCSTDSTWNIISELQSKHPSKIVAFRNQRNLGITGNSNEVLKRCRGKYIAFMGGDDIILPNKIEKQVSIMESDKSIVICYHNVELFDSISNSPIRNWYSDKLSIHPVYEKARKILHPVVSKLNIFAAMSVMVRREAIPVTGFDPRVPVASDWMLWIDVLAEAEKTARVVYLPQVLARYRRHDCNITNNIGIIRDDQFIVLAITEAKYPWLAADVRRGLGTIRYSRGVQEIISRNMALGRQLMFESLRCVWHPLFAAKVLYWVLVSFVPLLGKIRAFFRY